MQYEVLTIADYDEMLALWKNTPGIGLSAADESDRIAFFLIHNPGLSFVCKDQGRIIGTILCGYDGRRAYLYHIVVDQAYRSRGIGKTLVSKCFEALKAVGADECRLFVFKNNEIAKEFYWKTGWIEKNLIVVFGKHID